MTNQTHESVSVVDISDGEGEFRAGPCVLSTAGSGKLGMGRPVGPTAPVSSTRGTSS